MFQNIIFKPYAQVFEVAELRSTFQTSSFFAIVLAVLIHFSDVLLQLADFSCDLVNKRGIKTLQDSFHFMSMYMFAYMYIQYMWCITYCMAWPSIAYGIWVIVL